MAGELTSAADCRRALQAARAEAILHLGGIAYASDAPAERASALQAGQPAVPAEETFRVNVLGTYTLLEAAREAGVRVVAFASTLSILMSTPDVRRTIERLPIDETHPVGPTGSYGLSKRLNEETLWAFGRASGARTVAFRMVWVSMPHYPADWSWNPRLGRPAADPGAGFDTWQYLDARDAAAAYRLAIEGDDLPRSALFYLATDRTTAEPHRELVRRFYPELAAHADRLGPDDLIVSIRAARRALGYAPRHSWRGPEANAAVA
jgi:nucleoside-diphosphate-sugar epimerase